MASNSTTPIDCGFNGNPDLTGLGLRLSFYIQCITSALAAAFLNQHFDYIQSSSTAFYLATLPYLSGRSAMPAIVIIYAEATHSLALPRQIVRSVLLFSSMTYGAWFWHTGIDRLPPVEGCIEVNAYQFRKIDLRSDANRGVYKALSTMWASWKTDDREAIAERLAQWREEARKNPKSCVGWTIGIMSGLVIFSPES
ncbi:hypothetical protein QBC35DRAFT_457574 [Podospora australis]|uniref:Uncharacterized protein n=1 Tax=Podospora australis TaxID=1536484 RepID=A0AAN6WHF9_9PEZI|nr:hypothetical protein QBC35DRAFT_457574 [Podospora australis]